MKQKNTVLLPALMAAIITFLIYNNSFSQVTDKDGNVYKTITIGTQEWMLENLNVTHFRNGDAIPIEKDDDDWSLSNTPACCNYDNNSNNGKTYGKLYNYSAVNDPRGLAPKGWHIPNDAEWKQLIDYLGGDSLAGEKIKSLSKWKSPASAIRNESGFSAYPVGMRGGRRRSENCSGCFDGIGSYAYFWSSTEVKYGYNPCYSLSDNFPNFFYKNSEMQAGYSVRCIKD
jgi:uncharacterized protein (TIGR02145 family)